MIDRRDRELAAYDDVTHAAYRILAERGGGAVTETAGLMLAAGPHPQGFIVNGAFRIRRKLPPADALDRIRAHYEGMGYGFVLNSTAHGDADLCAAAEAAGWQRSLDLPAMVVRERLDDPPAPPGVELRSADPDRDRDAFGAIAATCFAEGDDEAEAYRMVFQSRSLLGGRGISAFIAALDGRDAAIAWSVVVGAAATVGWVGTLPELRRRGLGALVTRAATNAAFDLGARLVTLQASTWGEPVYAALGYETISTETVWLPPSER